MGDIVYGIDGFGDEGDFVFGYVGGDEGGGEAEGSVIYDGGNSSD
ncbi:MAG: hypothetical protein ACYS9Y_09170 [Planctomycetota bacterium]